MAWAPIAGTSTTTTTIMGITIVTPTMMGSSVPIRDFTYNTWLQAGYLACFIVGGTIRIPTFIMGILVIADVDISAFMYFSETWGLWGTIFAGALQWIFTLIDAITMPEMILSNILLYIWNIGVAMVIWITMTSIYSANIHDMGAWGRVNNVLREKCDDAWSDDPEMWNKCKETAYIKASSGIDEFPMMEEGEEDNDEELSEGEEGADAAIKLEGDENEWSE